MNDNIVWIKRFSKRPLLDNKNIIDLLKYENKYSLWWFLEWLMVYGKFHFLNLDSILQNPSHKNFKNNVAVYFKFGRLIFRKIIWNIFSFWTKKFDKSKKSICMISTLNQQLYDQKKEKMVYGDRFIPIINHISQDFNIFLIDIPYKNEFGFRAFWNGVKNKNILFFPIEHFMGFKEIHQAYKSFILYRLIWKKIKYSNSLNFLDNNIKRHIINNFDFFFSIYLFIILLELEAYKSFFRKFKVSLVCTLDSFGPSGFKPRIAFDGHVIGIQPGAMENGSLEYISNLDELKTYPLVDYWLVFDENIKNNFVKSKHFPKEKILIVGNYKKDDIFYKIKNYRLKISNEAVLLIGQDFHDKQEYSAFLKEAFLFLDKIPTIKKIIRPDPAERDIATYLNLIQEYNIQNVNISFKEDVIFPLVRSKFVISSFSTVLFEADLLGKNPVILDVFNKGYRYSVPNIASTNNHRGLLNIYKTHNPTKYKKIKPDVYKNIAGVIKILK